MPASPAGDANDKKKQKSGEETAYLEPRAGRREARRRELASLRMPVRGMEAEFNVFVDGVEIDPRKYWGSPGAFIDAPLLKRERSSFQLPTGGAVYFDRGVIEVVTPGDRAGARAARRAWCGTSGSRSASCATSSRSGRRGAADTSASRPTARTTTSPSSCGAHEQGPDRNIKTLALLLAYILPVPVAVVGTNRRSTGRGRAAARQPDRGHRRLHARPRPDDRHRDPRPRASCAR